MRHIIVFLLSFILISNSFSQVRMDVWNKSPNIGKTINQTVKSENLPKSFTTTLPDGKSVIYEKWERPEIVFKTSSGTKFTHKPIVYKSNVGFSLVSYNGKEWLGLYQSGTKSYSMTNTKIVQNTKPITNNCMVLKSDLDTSKSISKSVNVGNSVNFTNQDFYDPNIPINKVCSLYVEVANDVLIQFNNDVNSLSDFIDLMYQGVSYVYQREGITLNLYETFIWEGPSVPEYYGPNIALALSKFNYNKNQSYPIQTNCFFKQLLTNCPYNDGASGVSGLSSSCNGYSCGPAPRLATTSLLTLASNFTLPNPVTDFSNYIWSVQVASHELGHSFGSTHTHTCGFWRTETNQLISKIDSCNTSWCQPFKYPTDISIPSIMSYCYSPANSTPPYLQDYMLINGFGKYPRWAIRKTLYSDTRIPSTSTSNSLPEVTTNNFTNLTYRTVIVNGTVTNDGNSFVFERGFIYSKNPISETNPVNSYSIKIGDGIGNFSGSLLVNCNTTYYVRAYAKNSIGTKYGNEISFTTPSNGSFDPYLVSTEVEFFENVTNQIKIKSSLLSDGCRQIISKGFVWGPYPTSTLPTYENSGDNKTESFDVDWGNFEEVIQIDPSIKYVIRPYVKYNVNGVINFYYGNFYNFDVAFLTPVLIKILSNDITSTSVKLFSGISNISGGKVTTTGFLISENPNFDNPINLSNTVIITSPTTFSNQINDLTPNTFYYARSYAINQWGTKTSSDHTFTTLPPVNLPQLTTNDVVAGSVSGCCPATSGGNITSDGGLNITQRGVVWNSNPQPTLTNFTGKTSNGAGNGSFVSEMCCYGVEILPLTTYYVRSYATNSSGTSYGDEKTFIVPEVSTTPLMQTQNGLSTSPTSVSTGGNVIDQGGGPILSRGVIWSTSSGDISINLPTKTQNGSGAGSFTSTITGLSPNTTYYIKAYGKNNFGVGYGNLVGITTSQSGDKNCVIVGIDVSEGATSQGTRWFCQFNLNPNCPNYKVDVSRYKSNPNNNPNLQPTSTYVINNANPLSPNTTDINNGYIRLLMKPQPSPIDPIFGGWFSLNVKCNGLCTTSNVTKYYFYIAPQ